MQHWKFERVAQWLINTKKFCKTSQCKELNTQRRRAEVLWFLLTTLKNFKIYIADKTKSAFFPPLAKMSEVFCVAEVVKSVFGKMATVRGGVILNVS